MGGAISWWATGKIAQNNLPYDVVAVALMAPRRAGGMSETAPLSWFPHAQAPAVLVLSAGTDGDVPDDAHPYHERTTGEASFTGPTDRIATSTLVHFPAAQHDQFQQSNTPTIAEKTLQRLTRGMYFALFDTYVFGRNRFKDRLSGAVADPNNEAAPFINYWVSFHQGTRTGNGGSLSDFGSRGWIANFEAGSLEEGSWSVPDSDLDVTQGLLDTLNIGASYVDGFIGDQATCEQEFSGAFECEDPTCDPCQSYANRHRLGDLSSAGLRVRWESGVPGSRQLWLDVPEDSHDFSKRQYLSLEISTAYLDSLNDQMGHDVRFALRDGDGKTTTPTLLSEFGTKTADGNSTIIAPPEVRYPTENRNVIASLTGQISFVDFTTTYFRTYRIPLNGICDDGIDPTNITHVQLEFLESSGSMLLDEVTFEWAPDEPDVLACDGSLVEGEDPNGGGGGGGGDGDTGTGDEGSGTADDTGGTGGPPGTGDDGGGGCECSASAPGPADLLPGLLLGVTLTFRRRRDSDAR